MAISGPSSYVPTTEEFIAHWGLADAALGAGNEIVLAGAVNLAGLTAKKAALVTKRTLLQTKLTELEVARGDIEVRKLALLNVFGKFVDRVRALYPGTKYERALPTSPGINDSLGLFTDPMDSAAALWKLINDDPGLPDILIMGVTQTQFATQSTDLKTAFTTRTNVTIASDVTREERNDLQDEVYAILKNYRQALPTHFATGHALADSLPRLTPEPGSTPEAVTVNGTYVPAQTKAQIVHTKSTAPDFAGYELRMTPGPDYSADDDVVVATSSDINSLEFLTDAGLTTPGMKAAFKVFVKTTTGNEKGSNTVVITRPT
jgi:hypothetical protein